MTIGKFSVSNPVLVNILMVTLLILGTISLSRLPKEQFSEVPFFWVNIIVPYPGVAAEDIEKSVTVKIENEFQGINKLKRIQSTSSEGLSVVRIEFDDGISNEEFSRLYLDAQTRFSKVDLPEDTLPAIIDDFSSSDFTPVIEVVLYGLDDYSALNRSAELMKEKFLMVDQVAGVDLIGSREHQLMIMVDRNKIDVLGISIDEIVRLVRQQNVTVPGGAAETNSRTFLLRTISELEDTDEFANVIVRNQFGNQKSTILLGDIADIEDTYNENGIYSRYNGSESITLKIAKVPRGNSIKVIEGINRSIDEFRYLLPEELQIELINDSTIQIRDSIRILTNNALFGFVLLVVLLFLFIGLRNAIMTAIGIPVTFAITFIILQFSGETLNSNTLFGLVLVLGLIVDHAIVITENSFRLQQTGLSLTEAAIKGTNQVVVPVIAATLTTVAAFLPLMILPGTIGKFLRVIPLVVSIALIASTFESIVFLPAHYAEWPGGQRKSKNSDFFQKVQQFFRRVLERVYQKKGVALIGVFVIMIGAFGLVPTIRQDLFSAEDFTFFTIDIEMPAGSNRKNTDRIVRQFEEVLIPLVGNGEIVAVNSAIGYSSSSTGSSSSTNLAQISVDLTEQKEGRQRSIVQIMADIEKQTMVIPGAENVLFRKAVNGPPVDPPVSFRLLGNSYEELLEVSSAMKLKLGKYPEIFNIEDNLESGSPEMKIRINRERASQLNISPFEIGNFIRSSFDGITASTIFIDNEEIDVVVKYSDSTLNDLESLSLLKIPTSGGLLVPFSSIAFIEEDEGFATIKRIDGKREITMQAEAYSTEGISLINNDLRLFFDENFKDKYPDVTLKIGGEFAEFENLIFQILQVFLIGVFLIYLILGAQFKSYLQPVLILFSVPFSFVGVVLFLIISGTPFSTTVLYAGVALAGIAVNDSIVLISFINELRANGVPVSKAILQAAETRLRPILLTSLTTIAGLLPTALGIGGISVVWGPMASTIIFGLVFSTVTALIIIPCLYGLFFDSRKKVVIQ